MIWRIWAPGKVKIFSWLLQLNRLWCNDRLQRRGWANAYFCPLCMRNLETSVHLMWQSPFSKEIWCRVEAWAGCNSLGVIQQGFGHSTAAAQAIIRGANKDFRKGIRTMIMLITWEIWNERNNCIFRGKLPSLPDVIHAIRQNMEQWRLAGAKELRPLLGM